MGKPFICAYNQLLGNYKRKGMTVHLSYEEFYELCQIKECHYCGKTINRSVKKGEKGYRGYFIDRKNNDLQYAKENCVPCCWECNQAKGSRYTYEEFVRITNELKLFREEQKTPHWRSQIWFDPDDVPGQEWS
jgi:5-methylcytosine-specific restriction endonuclease McrA